MIEFIQNFVTLLNQISIYILIGLLFASILKIFLPEEFIKRHLGGNDSKAIFKSALIGIPLPLCSCSVIPFAQSLKESGASKSSIQTFLISTPITGVDSILATFGALGFSFTIFRLFSSVVISIVAGYITSFFDKEETKLQKSSSSCGCSCSCKGESKSDKPKFNLIDYAINTLLRDFSKALLIGLIIGALLNIFMPSNIEEFLQSHIIWGYLIALLISMPLYVCATASIPIGVSLLASGFSAGAVLIFLTAGPASNIVTMSVIYKMLGKKSLIIYLFSIIFGSLIFGYLLDMFLIDVDFESIVDIDEFGVLHYVSSVILFSLLLYTTFVPKRAY